MGIFDARRIKNAIPWLIFVMSWMQAIYLSRDGKRRGHVPLRYGRSARKSALASHADIPTFQSGGLQVDIYIYIYIHIYIYIERERERDVSIYLSIYLRPGAPAYLNLSAPWARRQPEPQWPASPECSICRAN